MVAGNIIRVFSMETWTVLQTITMEPSAWQIAKDPLGKFLMLASQQQNTVMLFSVESQGEEIACTLTSVVLVKSPRIFQYANIFFRTVGRLKGRDAVKRVKFAGFSNTGLKFCEVSSFG